MIKIAAYLTGFSSRSDGSAGIRFTTQEVAADDFGTFQQSLNQFGFLIFSPNQAQPSDIPKEEAEEKSKTPSKRLRAVLFILWRQTGEPGDFEVFYRDQMEKIIDNIKGKLD